MKKNTAGQYWRVYAKHRNTSVPATGIAATITATINKDYVGEVAANDANPTEIGGGYYDFALTQAETNAYQLSLKPTTTTNGVQVRACPETLTTETAAAVDPSTLTAAQAADAVWDEAKSEHTTVGTFGLWLGTKLWNWLGALAGKTADTTTRTEINATTAGVGYNETTDSLEAGRDNIGTAGAGLTGVSGLTPAQAASLAAIEQDTSTTLPAQIAALDIGGGTGTYACTWTVNDGSTVLEGATVSFWLAGVLRGTGTTNASGQVSMSLDAGTYTVAISLSGYTFASTTHTVSSTASTWTKTFSMAAIVFSPTPDEDQVTAWGFVYSSATVVEPGATIVLEQRTAGARQIYDNAPRTLTADANGLVSAVVWADGSEYRYRRGTGGEWSELFAPEDDEDPDLPNSYRLPGWLGAS